jgi:hypothetical protein
MVFFSIPGADCAIWKHGCCAKAFNRGGNLEYVKRAYQCQQRDHGQLVWLPPTLT